MELIADILLGSGALAAGLHARVGKRLRWFGRVAPASPWVMLHAATQGEFVELAACLLLADRNGAASHAQLETGRELKLHESLPLDRTGQQASNEEPLE